ncbi:MAG TPA: SPOR domain-containing protein [Gammaproteobacteria bacterium]|nr:SPOR domain-containing protein [Gammaproteobacteria bacterium]
MALLLVACSSGGPAKPGAASLPNAGTDSSPEQRLQALEAGLQQLAQRVEALQAAAGPANSGNLTSARTDRLPPEYQPVRPGIVLAAHPVRRATVPAAIPVPATEPPPAPAQQPAPKVQPPGEGDWVINLASYNSRGIASRKLAEFVDGGVAAEQVKAEVNGSTVYRLRVPGFDSYRAASAEAGAIRAQLGLADTWVARR